MHVTHMEPDRETGLTTEEARRRLQEFGPNVLASEAPPRFLDRLLHLSREPTLILLLVAAAIYFAVGSAIEGVMLMLFALFSISLMLMQERRSAKAVAALRQMAAPLARARRDGRDVRLPSAHLVPGDLMILSEGERVPADGELVAASRLAVDESLLTGESLPVDKSAGPDVSPALQRIFGGTLVVNGHGLARATQTGGRTEAGKLGASLATITSEETHLQRTTGRLVRQFGVLALLVCGSLALYYGLVAGDWVQGLLSGVALGMAMLPEEFPVVLAIFLAIGSWRMAQVGVLVRRAAAIEALGAATCLCVDKTGTITENRMELRYLDNGVTRLDVRRLDTVPDHFLPLLTAACQASRRGGFDPMDVAVWEFAGRSAALDPQGTWRLVNEYGVTAETLAVSQAWRDNSGSIVVASKGAPETVTGLCALDPGERSSIVKRAHAMASEGLRVLAVAEASWEDAALPADPRGFAFRYLGLIAFADPMRASVPAAIAAAHAAGIGVKMITGDFPATARAIAAAAGIPSMQVVTGDDLRAAGPDQIQDWVRTVSVFARVRPEQKLQLVDALQAIGQTVAMTGDGVNDAPALKSADIGIAMGKRGTDVAREAADIVLVDGDFGRLVDGVRLGRRIFDNLRKVIIYLAAVHVPVAGLGLFPVVLGMPIVIWPLHVVILEMLVDSMSSLAFEDTPAESNIMRRPPRPRDEGVVALPQLLYGLSQGGVVLAAAFGIYVWALASGISADVARAMTLTTAIVGNLGLVVSNASQKSIFVAKGALRLPPLFLPIATLMLALLLLAIYVPGLRDLFKFGVPSEMQLFLAFSAALASWLLVETAKMVPGLQRIVGA